MKIKTKRIPYGRQWIGAEEIRAATRVLRSDFLTQGPLIEKFEAMLAKKVGAKYAVAVANGTAALHLAALALGLKPGDEVITTPMSFLATSNAILYTGAKPVFVDIDPDTQCIDPLQVEKKITRHTKAIFVTDFAGHPAELKALYAIAKKYRLKVVEDAAHALGAVYRGSKVGSCRFADMTIFSFHPVKHITTGEGGAVLTNDRGLWKRLCSLRTHGVVRDPEHWRMADEGPWYYEMQYLGFNYRLTEIQAALGTEQLKKLNRFVARRRAIARQYRKAFSGLEGVLTPVEQPNSRHAYHLFVIRLCGILEDRRKEFFEKLQSLGIAVQVHYMPIPAHPYYAAMGYRADDYPNAQAYYRSALSLPMFPRLTDKKVKFVIKTIKDVVRAFSQ
jgi:UDP-4-amino-4,6-dideoxy-N-acetyl-beta-L-altrosamine transaminase